MKHERVKYKVINHDINQSIWLEHDPKGWDNSERTLKREKTFGMMTELSKNLVFVKDGADFYKQGYAFKRGEANFTLEEYRFHPKTSHPYLHSTGTHDFSKFKRNRLEAKAPFKSGGLNALIKSKIREKFELERLESINGKVIDPINKKLVSLTSRDILLVSKLETNEQDSKSESFRMNFSDGNHRTGSLGIPTEVTVNSDEHLGYVIKDASFTTTPDTGETTSMFYYNNDVTKVLEIKIKVYCNVKSIKVDDLSNEFLKVDLARFNGGNTPTLLNRTTLYDVNMSTINNHVIDFEYSESITLLPGESLSLQWYGGGNFGNGFPIPNDGDLKVDFEETKASIDIVENSKREDSQTYAYLMNDIGEKLMQIITGEKGRFYSEYLTSGEFSKLALTSGFWIRQFYEKNMQISLDEFLKTLNAICNTSHHIEIINGKETLVVEEMKFYFQPSVAIILDQQVTDLEYENASEFCHSTLEFGYDDTGEYEEAMGLDEPNIKTGFTTPLNRVETKYSKISKSKAGNYPKEFARRKLKKDYPTTDSTYDKWLFLLDLKEGLGLALEERTWEDDFEEAPTGIYSPNTATNLRLSPSQIEKRHQWFYGTGVLNHQDDKIRYSNTGGNNLLSTKEIGKAARSEKDDINISDLDKARFAPEWATFKHPLRYDVLEQINGKTNVNGRDIPNVYFRVEFIDDEGNKKTGYLFQESQKEKNLGEFKLLISN